MEKITVRSRDKSYDILIETGLFHKLPSVFRSKYQGKKLALITDSNVDGLYGKKFAEMLENEGFEVVPAVFPAGEQSKTLRTLEFIYNKLADNFFTRSDVIVALGGGVTGDMAGLAAATFLRGLGYIQVPTSLLAMVDSSIGGKVAVDMRQGKNLVGAFYQPDAVYTDPGFLETLSYRHYADGIAELLKHGFIKDAWLYHELLSQKENGPKGRIPSGAMEGIIARSCLIKRSVVEEDEFDHGARQLLNFGHTIGHAIERVQGYTGLSHGEAISVGMAVMTEMTEKMGLTGKGVTESVRQALTKYGLPVTMPDIDIGDIISAIAVDKKNRSGKITIAYIEEIGAGKLLEMSLAELGGRICEILEDRSGTS